MVNVFNIVVCIYNIVNYVKYIILNELCIVDYILCTYHYFTQLIDN